MTSKTKLNLLSSLNQFILGEFLGNQQTGASTNLQDKWQSSDIQKRLGGIVGLKPREVLQGPQRNISAYLYFCEDMRKEILDKNPGIKPNKVMILFGQYWRQLSESEKAPYEEKAVLDKARYSEYLKNNKNVSKKKIKPSVYNLFCSEERKLIKEEFPEMKATEIRNELGKRWKIAKETNTEILKEKYGYEKS
jgi:hypothetical protein